jgi:hypothetical protein
LRPIIADIGDLVRDNQVRLDVNRCLHADFGLTGHRFR